MRNQHLSVTNLGIVETTASFDFIGVRKNDDRDSVGRKCAWVGYPE